MPSWRNVMQVHKKKPGHTTKRKPAWWRDYDWSHSMVQDLRTGRAPPDGFITEWLMPLTEEEIYERRFSYSRFIRYVNRPTPELEQHRNFYYSTEPLW